ncbi:Glycolipid transfer protein [Toxocara canis]|uniref:Glycolipid transfer protein n=1 Tax=Toxocara canis TaxID=6265 RepID=A0A0B2ULK4_TOXCA|nr:Glycolipid transfer protein [Toxocara canis]
MSARRITGHFKCDPEVKYYGYSFYQNRPLTSGVIRGGIVELLPFAVYIRDILAGLLNTPKFFYDDLKKSVMSSAPCAEVRTYFSHAERMFPEMENGKVPTEQFLRACQGIADFVGFLGTAFIPVKNDISGNVSKVRSKFESDREKLKYIEDLIDDDLAHNGGKLGYATEGLLWLKRGLEFMLELLTEMVREYRSSADKSSSESLVAVINKAYVATLKRHHGFVSKQLFKVVIVAAPYRRTILKALAEGNEGIDDICIDHIAAHLDNFRTNVAHLVDYYIEKKLDTPNPMPTCLTQL